MIYPPDMYPSKARKIRLRKKYNVNIRFMCAITSPEVINLKKSNGGSCNKQKNYMSNYKKCLDACEQMDIIRMCQCNPTFLYEKNGSYNVYCNCSIENNNT